MVELSGQIHAPAASALGEETPLPFGYESGRGPKPVWTWWRRENIPFPVPAPAGN
jgi:hypothetical protein